MKKTVKKQLWESLTENELLEINGGSERKSEKQGRFWEYITQILKF